MRTRKSMVQLKKFQVNERQKQLSLVQTMLTDLERSKLELDRAIQVEEQRSGVSDPQKVTYSSLAKSLRDRRANIDQSIDGLKARVAAAEEALEDSQAEYQRAIDLDARENNLMRA